MGYDTHQYGEHQVRMVVRIKTQYPHNERYTPRWGISNEHGNEDDIKDTALDPLQRY